MQLNGAHLYHPDNFEIRSNLASHGYTLTNSEKSYDITDNPETNIHPQGNSRRARFERADD